jgi:phasin family protein
MITETLSALTKPTQGLLEPVQKLKHHAVSTVEKLAAHQLESLKTYSDTGVGQLKAAAEVKDIDGLQNFMSKQTDVLRALGEQVLSDLTATAQLGVDFLSQATKVGAKAIPLAPAKPKAA